MSDKVVLQIRMELLSDVIFGSGYSIPGGEDVAVSVDKQGWPYLKGSTLKGLLRESMENILVWTGDDSNIASVLLGAAGWDGTEDSRRVHLTELHLEESPATPEDCFSSRTFTALENGVVKEKTLRIASCVRAGLCFTGEIHCLSDDVALLKRSLAGIKWVGTLRNRGFGRVRITAEVQERSKGFGPKISMPYIRYRLKTLSPVLATDLNRSRGNSYETKGYIPGSAIRGWVINTLANSDHNWFEEHRAELLSDNVRFLDAFPYRQSPKDGSPLAAIPSPMGFYENKEETVFETVVKDGSFTPGLKRAGLGAFCALLGDTVLYWSASTSGAARIKRSIEEKEIFQTRYIDANQVFEGYIQVQSPELAEKISSSCLVGEAWIGADRYSGFGKCEFVGNCDGMNAPEWQTLYGPHAQSEISDSLYMLAVSPFTMLDEYGNPCGLNESELAEMLGIDTLSIELCSTSVTEYRGYNRTLQSRIPAVTMYERGSLFHIRCDHSPELSRLMEVEKTGLGIRREDGFGQVLFLRNTLFESLAHKKKLETDRSNALRVSTELRRKRYTWITKHAKEVLGCTLSKSQVGTIQTFCEKAIAKNCDLTELYAFLGHNLTDRGAQHGAKFEKIEILIKDVLDKPLGETLDTNCADSTEEKLRLLCELFDFTRKSGGEGNR